MYILGDIGNTETKLCIVSKSNKISKKITFLSKSITNKHLNILFKKNKIKLNKISILLIFLLNLIVFLYFSRGLEKRHLSFLIW